MIKMKLNYFKIGDVVKEDEINALISIFFNNQDKIKDTMVMDMDGYETDFGTYITKFYDTYNDESKAGYLSTNVYTMGEKLVIKRPIGYIKVTCQNRLNCTYSIMFKGREYQSGGGVISIPLQDFADEFDENEFLMVDNKFDVKIKYKTPFIKDIKGDDHIINTTEELNNIIETAEDNEIIRININNNIQHNITSPIGIDKKTVIITGGNFISKTGVRNRIFNVTSDSRLELNNVSFTNFPNCNSDGGLINNAGECVIRDCSFITCVTTGNGIIKSTGNLAIENTSFASCRAKNGGAIFTDKDEV